MQRRGRAPCTRRTADDEASPMSAPAALASVATLASPRIARRASIVLLLCVCERLLTPAAAWAIFERPLFDKALVTAVLGVIFTLRAFVQRSFLARTEADLFDRVIESLLRGDVLRANVLPN